MGGFFGGFLGVFWNFLGVLGGFLGVFWGFFGGVGGFSFLAQRAREVRAPEEPSRAKGRQQLPGSGLGFGV